MSKFLTVRDTGFVNGMNTVDDPKALKDGESVELLNAYPGYPLVPRRGCEHVRLGSGFPAESCIIPGTLFGFEFENKSYFLFWMTHPFAEDHMVTMACARADGTRVADTFLHNNAAVKQSGGKAVSYAKVGDYVLVSAGDALWRVELGKYENGDLKLRFIPVPTAGSVLPNMKISVSSQHSGEWPDPWAYGYSFTFVHNKDATVGESGVFTPVDFEMEIPGTEGVFAYSLDPNFNRAPNINIECVDNVWYNPFAFTHVRVYRTINYADVVRGADFNITRWLPGVSPEANYTTLVNGLPGFPGVTNSVVGRIAPGGIIWFRKQDKVRYTAWLEAERNNEETGWEWFRTTIAMSHGLVGYEFSKDDIYTELRNPDYETNMNTMKDMLGGTRFFVVDLPLTHFVFNGTANPLRWQDNVTDGALDGEMNQFPEGYAPPPSTGRLFYFKNRLFIGGENGQVFFSEVLGGSGTMTGDLAQFARSRYATMFKPLDYRIDLASEGGHAFTGFGSLGDDLYLFAENRAYMIVAGDPLYAPLRVIDDRRGCPFPDTITRFVSSNERECLFYLSGDAPMVIRQGGYAEEFAPFKVKELWRHKDGELVTAQKGDVVHCFAGWWDNVLWVFYTLRDARTKTYGFRMMDDAKGAFRCEFGREGVVDIGFSGMAVTHDGRAFMIESRHDSIRLVDFLSDGAGVDRFDGYVNYPAIRIVSRKHLPGPRERNMSELMRAVVTCDFDMAADREILRFEVFNNRYRSEHSYANDDGHVWENATEQPIEQARRCISFVPKADFIGEYYQYAIEVAAQSGSIGNMKTAERKSFNLYGVELEAVPRPQLDTENFGRGGERESVWFDGNGGQP